ncbi:MAG: hypothetical protein MUF81_06885 [Verrucomicrobia bacterium]|jgi:hypothetical protein|nr:hypothetical protein [Verrucomicrobiota bacterium]
MLLEKYSAGAGDRFAQQAEAQPHACVLARDRAAVIGPGWNKSSRVEPFYAVDRARLPRPTAVASPSADPFASALRHKPHRWEFNPSLRQLIHVGYKVATQKGAEYLKRVKANREIIAHNVTGNLFDRHFKPIFLG